MKLEPLLMKHITMRRLQGSLDQARHMEEDGLTEDKYRR